MKKIFSYRSIILILIGAFSLLYLALSHGRNEPEILFPVSSGEVVVQKCADYSNRWNKYQSNGDPIIFFVTPTFSRPEQAAEMIRLGQTLLHIKNLIWIIAEDSDECSTMIQSVLKKFHQIPSVQIASPMPKRYLKEYYKPRGVSSRNAALDWIQANKPRFENNQMVVYFGDDDNTYDLLLFDEIRSTQRVSMFPVGLIGNQGISSPIVKDGKVIGFTDPWFEKRHFPIDMAGFAFNWQLMEKASNNIVSLNKTSLPQQPRMPYKAGHEEDLFLRALKLKIEDIEPKANDCTEILVWHTQTVKKKKSKVKLNNLIQDSSLENLVENLKAKGIISVSNDGTKIPTCLETTCP